MFYVEIYWEEPGTEFALKCPIPQNGRSSRDRYLEGMDNGQMTPCGNPNFNSYVTNLLFQTDGQTDGQTDREISLEGAVTHSNSTL
jgi:hypothetical protein